MGRLDQKVILITGATSGIGEAAARLCLAEGAQVMIHGLDEVAGKALATDLGANAAFYHADLREPEAVEKLMHATIEQYGALHGLVNNAAYIVRSNLDSTDVTLFDEVMAVNVRSPLFLIKAARPYLKQTKGSIVNIGSVNAYTGEPRLLAYAISKGALMTLSRNLGNVLPAEGIRVNHFNPGWVLTPNEYKYKLADGLPPDWPERLGIDEIPSGKMTSPEDIARHIVFWLSDDSRPISGTVMELNQYPVIARIPLKEGDHEST
ncbi:MAG: SDR family oxidoreductase [Saprospiraceae bacterium]|nr:SDR family oxidoreductase [Saprospiraceae bacterium]